MPREVWQQQKWTWRFSRNKDEKQTHGTKSISLLLFKKPEYLILKGEKTNNKNRSPVCIASHVSLPFDQYKNKRKKWRNALHRIIPVEKIRRIQNSGGTNLQDTRQNTQQQQYRETIFFVSFLLLVGRLTGENTFAFIYKYVQHTAQPVSLFPTAIQSNATLRRYPFHPQRKQKQNNNFSWYSFSRMKIRKKRRRNRRPNGLNT